MVKLKIDTVCFITYENISKDELQNNCKIYKSGKCQKFFKDPIKNVPTCSEANEYRSVSAINNMEETISNFNKACGIGNK